MELNHVESLRAHPMHLEAINEGRKRMNQAMEKVLKRLRKKTLSFQEGNYLMEEVYSITKELERLTSQFQ